MKYLLALQMIALSSIAPGSSLPLEHTVYCGTDSEDIFQYDDGSAQWIFWGGEYRGVWFNVEDFYPGIGFDCEQLEFWFFHHASYPWEDSSFEAILANGDATAPVTELASESVSALHYSPVYAVYGSVVCEGQFWALNHSLTEGGWPSILADDGSGGVEHSFYSDAFGSGYAALTMGDFLIRAHGTILATSLDYTSWGAIKSLYGN